MSSQRSEESVQDQKVPIEDELEEANIVNYQPLNLQLDTGDEYTNFRQKWWQLCRGQVTNGPPPPAPPHLDDAVLTPLANASFFSQLTYTWITGIMVGYSTTNFKVCCSNVCIQVLGYQRTLQASDLYKLDTSRESAVLAAKLEAAWQRRVKAAADWNAVLRIIGDMGQLMGPLVLRQIVVFAEERSAAIIAGEPVPNVGRGIAMAIGLFALTMIASVCTHQVCKARVKFSNAALLNHISTDVTRIDACAQWFVTVCLIILLTQLGPSALAAPSALGIDEVDGINEPKSCWRLSGSSSFERRNCMVSDGILSLRFGEHGARYVESQFFAATLAFVPYTLTTHNVNVAVIFSSLSLFQGESLSSSFSGNQYHMPRALSSIPDASSAIKRLTPIFQARSLFLKTHSLIDKDQELALLVKDATFDSKDGARGSDGPESGKDKNMKEDKAKDKPVPGKDAPLFRVKNVDYVHPTSLLQGLIGEMRKVSGHVTFGGRIGYCQQTAWIQNATLRDNITFGRPFEEDRYWRVLEIACLLPDLQLLPDGDLTEIGEKGINLSGGQKQRVNIARALYFDPEIVIFDDPLSAVDAHVGKSLFQDAILGALRNRGVTVILVTHAIHFLSQVDYIYTMNNGVITESGTYDELISRGGDFARLDMEFGDDDQAKEVTPQTGVTIEDVKLKSDRAREKATGIGKLEGRLMVKEKRSTGSLSWRVLFFIIAMQGSQILNSYTLVWWGEQRSKFDRPNSFYQILYGCLGVSQTVFTFLLTYTTSQYATFFYAPMSFFDTTPTGRLLSVLGKDIDSIDNQLSIALRLVIIALSAIMGSVIIVSALEPYLSQYMRVIAEDRAYPCLVIAVFFIVIGVCYFSAFYRASAREVKRLEASSLIRISRQSLAHYFPSLRWLAIRLDFMGNILVFVVALLAVSDVSGINAAQIGLVLTYTMVQYVEGDTVPQEAPHEIEDRKPPAQWPEHGVMEFNNVKMAYRPGLPNVLRGISIKVRAGEKIGVVGRTGAGKSSLMLALFRIVELSGGSITIDGVDISTIGLKDLRSKISIIPQDVWTIRSNLDPFSTHGDAELWDALHRSCLVDSNTDSTQSISSDGIRGKQTSTSRHQLDSTIESEGANLSVGERSLLSLARAMVKDCKVVVLDEATASVDLETDNKIQHTIQTEFKDRTLLCIAHRLRTIISYDRILVLDAGLVAEFDTPTNLFKVERGIFRGMCERSNISLKDIETSRQRGYSRPQDSQNLRTAFSGVNGVHGEPKTQRKLCPNQS
ncbi:ABC protein [Suillus ampliporus]|nr:ABC protein [Suillus ampliporus]